MERDELYETLRLPESSIDFYEDILDEKRQEKVVDRYGLLYIYHGLIFIILTGLFTFSYLFVESYDLLRFDFVANYVTIPIIFCGILIFLMSLSGGLQAYYYRYYNISPLYGSNYSDDLLLAVMVYKKYKDYFIDGEIPVIFNTRNIFREENSKVKRFLHSTTENKEKFLHQNTTHFLHETAQYYSAEYNDINNEFIDQSLIGQVDDEYIGDMCEKMNDAFINQRNKEAMFLARHILEVSIKHIFENDPEFRIEYQRDYESNGGTTLGGLVDLLGRRTNETYQMYLNGHFNSVEEFKGDVMSVNGSLNSFIHGDESFEEIFDEKQFKQDYEDIFRILLIIRKNVDIDQTVSGDGKPESDSSNSESKSSKTEDYESASFDGMDMF